MTMLLFGLTFVSLASVALAYPQGSGTCSRPGNYTASDFGGMINPINGRTVAAGQQPNVALGFVVAGGFYHGVGHIEISDTNSEIRGVAISVGSAEGQVEAAFSVQMYAQQINSTAQTCDDYKINYNSQSTNPRARSLPCNATQITHMGRLNDGSLFFQITHMSRLMGGLNDGSLFYHFTIPESQNLENLTLNYIILGANKESPTAKNQQEFTYGSSNPLLAATDLADLELRTPFILDSLLIPVHENLCQCSGNGDFTPQQEDFCNFIESDCRLGDSCSDACLEAGWATVPAGAPTTRFHCEKVVPESYTWSQEMQRVQDSFTGDWTEGDTIAVSVVCTLSYILFIILLMRKYDESDEKQTPALY